MTTTKRFHYLWHVRCRCSPIQTTALAGNETPYNQPQTIALHYSTIPIFLCNISRQSLPLHSPAPYSLIPSHHTRSHRPPHSPNLFTHKKISLTTPTPFYTRPLSPQ